MVNKIEELLAEANVKINGNRDQDIQVHNKNLFNRILSGGTLAVGESYMDGWWSCKKLDEFFSHVLRAQLEKKVRGISMYLLVLKSVIFNKQNIKGAKKVGKEHYDLGNDLYEKMLDKHMNYSCGYWKKAKTLDEAQIAKLELCCKKLGLKKGMKVLDIGCGWGAFASYAARKYQVKVDGITISKEQAALAKKMCKGLPVNIMLKDYRKLTGKYDAIISIGMFEHVGYKNYDNYFKTVERLLEDDGIFLLHTIGGNRSVRSTEPWINKYIFPGGQIPSLKQIMKKIEGKFIVEDLHNFGHDYDKTLMAWYANFNKHWPQLKKKYSPRFYKMWEYYLLSCAGSFRARKNQLWQLVLHKKGVIGGHTNIR